MKTQRTPWWYYVTAMILGLVVDAAVQSSDPATGLVIPAQMSQRFLDEEGNN